MMESIERPLFRDTRREDLAVPQVAIAEDDLVASGSQRSRITRPSWLLFASSYTIMVLEEAAAAARGNR